MEKAVFSLEDGSRAEFFVLEKAKLSGKDYILVTDVEEGDGDAWIFREIKTADNKDVIYEEVTDDDEFSALSSLFASLLEDVDLN